MIPSRVGFYTRLTYDQPKPSPSHPPRRGRVRPARHSILRSSLLRPASRGFSRGGRELRRGVRGGGEVSAKPGISNLKIRSPPIAILLSPGLKGTNSQFLLPHGIESSGQTLTAGAAKKAGRLGQCSRRKENSLPR